MTESHDQRISPKDRLVIHRLLTLAKKMSDPELFIASGQDQNERLAGHWQVYDTVFESVLESHATVFNAERAARTLNDHTPHQPYVVRFDDAGGNDAAV